MHKTSLGYVAVIGRIRFSVDPWYLRKIPVRAAAAVGFLYFTGSLIGVLAGGPISFYAPIGGILAALAVFVHQTVELWGGMLFRRRLRAAGRRGQVLFVPGQLVQEIARIYEERDKPLPLRLSDAQKTTLRTAVESYHKSGMSPKLQRMLESL
ncbi:MAG TPA: hypothetical protein VK694_03095 [Verrucomicrobiae bacterium]|nr:hypothetical protein [Verrucomicrobiae bacterium]